MNLKQLRPFVIALGILFCSFHPSIAQENATLSLLRPKQSLMSGGSGFTVQVFLNKVRIDDLANGVALNYSFISEGEVILKLQKEGMGTLHGAPKTIKLDVKKGDEYYYFVEAGMNSLNVEVLDKKKAEKLTSKSKNFEATLDLKEDSESTVVE